MPKKLTSDRISSRAALQAAVECAHLYTEQLYDERIRVVDGLYEIHFCADALQYDFYVDSESAEIKGFSFTPVMPCLEETEVKKKYYYSHINTF